jgi:hypothetical protein
MHYQNKEPSSLKMDTHLKGRQPATPVEGVPQLDLRAKYLDDNREDGLDNTLSETFPCSDPLSSIPNPAVVV